MARSEKSENKNRVLGLDIGNGYGYVSLLENPKNDPIPLLPASLSTQGMPTTAYVKPPNGEQIDVFSDGRAAEQKYARTPQQLVYAAKTRLPELTLKIPGIERPVQAGHIYAAVAHDLLVLAEKELANKGIPPVYDVVFTFPAAFADNVPVLEIMQENLGKVEINGKPIQVLSRLPEPAAVAIDYLHYMQHIAPEQIRIKKNEFTVLVYDLGHGTFDTAIVTAQSEGTPYKMHAKDGLEEVGGKDFDNVLYQELLSVLQKQYGFEPQNEIQRAEIMREAVKAKIALTDDNSYLASVMNQQNEYCEVEITRERFEKLSEPLVFQTLEVVQKMLEEAEEKGITMDAIVLSGGGSKVPMIRASLEKLVEDKYPIIMHRPSEAVSFGASRFAGASRFGYGDGVAHKEDTEEESENKEIETEEKKPVTEEEDDNVKNTNPVLEQQTDRCYGIWYPSEGKLEGEIRFLVTSGQTRPFRSEPISFVSQSSRIVIKVFQSKEKNQVLETDAEHNCDGIVWIPFHVKKGTKYNLTLTAQENYGVQVDIQSDNGEHYTKSTTDEWKKLTDE